MNNKILAFESRQLSYGSSACFLESICRELEKSGYEVERCPIDSIENSQDILMQYIGQSFQMILDINSILPLAEEEEGYYLDLIDAPFYNFIVDHPMHLHERLMVPLRNYSVICLDQVHVEYVKKYYPHIKDVIWMPYAGLEALTKVEFLKRDLGITYPATYIPPKYYWKRIEKQNRKLAIDMLDILTVSPEIPIEKAYSMVRTNESFNFCDDFAEEMCRICNIDRFIREYFREKAITELLRVQWQVDVFGMNWEMYQGVNKKYLKIHKPLNYRNMLEAMGNSKVVFNVQPLFTDSPHDRVMNSFINGAVAFTDGCSYLKNHFEDGVDLFLYERNQLDLLPDIIDTMFSDYTRLESMASSANGKAQRYHTWEYRTKILLDQLSK